MAETLTDRQRRLLTIVLALSAITLGFVVVGFISQAFLYFSDLILIIFLAWLIAFMLGPVVGGIERLIPRLSRVGAVAVVYLLLLGTLVLILIFAADVMARSISDFIRNAPGLRGELPELLAPWQAQLDGLGLTQIRLADQATAFLDNLSEGASALVGPLQQLAVASLGVLGNLVLVLVFSIYLVIDRDRIVAFLLRLVPRAATEEARLLESSVARSFGGFLRGQALLGFVYAIVALITSLILNLDYLPVTTAASGLLMAIPFFGPFVSWLPPVLVAIVTQPEAIVPSIILMGVGWFVVMNIVQPRLMGDAVGVHPLVVLASVLIGYKLAGVAGAVFAVPIAAVMSAFFFFYLDRVRPTGSVAARAAQRLGQREGRRVRMPREPVPADEADVGPAQADLAGTRPNPPLGVAGEGDA